MKTTFEGGEWEKFRDDCEMYACRAAGLQLACWKTVEMIEHRLESETRNDIRLVLESFKNDCVAQIDMLQRWQTYLERCDQDDPSQVGEATIGAASYAMRKVLAWSRLKQIRPIKRNQVQPIEYSKDADTIENSDSVGVWTICFSRD